MYTQYTRYDKQRTVILSFSKSIYLFINTYLVAIFMRHCFCSKYSNFGTIFAAARFMPKTSVKIAWHEPNDNDNIISNLSNSDSTIIQNHFFYCFNVFIGCRRARATRTSIAIDIFSVFLRPVIPKLILCSAQEI